jgi:hypothetical protein
MKTGFPDMYYVDNPEKVADNRSQSGQQQD